MTSLNIGPFVINAGLLAYLLSAFGGYWVLKFRLKRAEEAMSGFLKDKIANALIISIFAWKFSSIVFDPVSVVRNPLSLIYFPPGDKGVWLAAGITAVYLWLSMRKRQLSLPIVADALASVFLGGSALFHLLQLALEQDRLVFHIAAAILSLALGVGLFVREKLGDAAVLLKIVLWFSLGQIFVLFLDNRTAVWIFSRQQMVFLVTALISLLWLNKLDKNQSREA